MTAIDPLDRPEVQVESCRLLLDAASNRIDELEELLTRVRHELGVGYREAYSVEIACRLIDQSVKP